MAYTRRSFSDTAVKTTLTADVTSTDTSFPVAATTGWTTTNGPIVATIDRGTASEEKVEVTAFTSSSMTVTRGYGGTTPQTHSNGAAVEHTICGTDLDEANLTVSKTVGLVAAAGDILAADGPNSLKKIAKGTSGQALKVGGSDSSGLEWDGVGLLATAEPTGNSYVIGTSWEAQGNPAWNVTFTAPASGNVLIRLTGLTEWVDVSGTSLTTAYWGVATHGTTTPVAAAAVATGSPVSSGTNPTATYSVDLRVTGLTAGTSYTYDWIGATSSSSVGFGVQSSATTPDPTSATQEAQALMEVWAA